VIEGHESPIGRASKKLLAMRRATDGRRRPTVRRVRKGGWGIDNRRMELMVRGS